MLELRASSWKIFDYHFHFIKQVRINFIKYHMFAGVKKYIKMTDILLYIITL